MFFVVHSYSTHTGYINLTSYVLIQYNFLLQRIEIQKVDRTYLFMCYGHLPEELMKEDCVYFLRNTPGMVPLPNTIEEANEQLPALFEIGLLNGHSLVMLEQVISQVRTHK